MDKQTIKEKVNQFFAEDMEIDAALIKDDALLVQDLGMSSLDFVDVKSFLHREFLITAAGKDLLALKTMDDVYTFIFDHQSQE